MVFKDFLSKFAPFILAFAFGLLLGSFLNTSKKIIDNESLLNLKETQKFSIEEVAHKTDNINQAQQLEKYDNARAKVEELRKQICNSNIEEGIFPPPVGEAEIEEEIKQK